MKARDKVEEASEQSFPASDPPGWIRGSATREGGPAVDREADDESVSVDETVSHPRHAQPPSPRVPR